MRPRERVLFLASIFTLVLGVIASLLVQTTPATAQGFATLRVLAGVVDVREAGEVAFLPGTDGLSLQVGDTVRTGPDGRAAIGFFDGSETRIDFATTFTIEDLERYPSGATGVEASHVGGRTFSRVATLTDSMSRFDVSTPTATASVRGTRFATIHHPDGSSSTWVLEGVVAVRTSSGAIADVSAGFGVTASPGGDLVGPFELDAAMLGDPWITFNECEIDGQCADVLASDADAGEPASDPLEPAAPDAAGAIAPAPAASSSDEPAAAQPSKPSKPKEEGPPSGPGDGPSKPAPPPSQSPPPAEEPPPPPEPEPEPVQQVVEVICETAEGALGDIPPPC